MTAEIQRTSTRGTSPKPALPGLRRNRTAEPKLKMGEGPDLARNNSIDPNSLSQKPRRMRQRPSAVSIASVNSMRSMQSNDSGLTYGSCDSLTSFASRYSCSVNNHESMKFSVQNFVNQKKGTLESTYDMGELIGEGGFGEVYSCYHIETDEERAVKVMVKSTKKESINEEIVKEYNILKELDHPNILKVYEMFETKTHFFIVTDLYSGGDLFSELEDNGCFNEYEAAELMNAMLMCMNYCHKKQLVHLDLKPENVLLTDTKNYFDVKIIDFGLAQYQEQNLKMTGLEGSSYYMSPQVVQRSYTGSKADVWSCGVICHVMMTGYAPFDGPSYKDILKSIVVGEFDFEDPEWDEASEECKNFIRYCLTYDEDERPSAEDALKHPFLRKCRRRTAKADVHRRSSMEHTLKKLETFSSRHSKLKQATCAIMASQLLTQEEKDQIDTVFRHLDTSCDGQIDRGDLKRGYREYFDTEVPEAELDNIFDQVNFSGSGVIEYSEFAIAILMAQNTVDNQKLKAAFRVFDEDAKGYISAEDIKRVLKLGDEQDGYLRTKILRQVDAEETGAIDFEEFKTIMHSTSSLQKKKKKKKKKRVSLKRSPRRSFVATFGGVDVTDLQLATVLDGMDASELSMHSSRGRSYRGADLALEDLCENEDEDLTSERETRRGTILADCSQSSQDE